MAEFDDMPTFANRTWRELTRWLHRNGFEEARAQVLGGDTSMGPGHTRQSSIWFRRRAEQRTEAIRIDALGHRPSGFQDRVQTHRLDPSVVVARTGYGDVRHFHKETIDPANEQAYQGGPVATRITYNDHGTVIANNDFGGAHIPINP